MRDMEDTEFEDWLRSVLSEDLSVGTDEFEEALLIRCLEVIRESGPAEEELPMMRTSAC